MEKKCVLCAVGTNCFKHIFFLHKFHITQLTFPDWLLTSHSGVNEDSVFCDVTTWRPVNSYQSTRRNTAEHFNLNTSSLTKIHKIHDPTWIHASFPVNTQTPGLMSVTAILLNYQADDSLCQDSLSLSLQKVKTGDYPDLTQETQKQKRCTSPIRDSNLEPSK